MPRIDAPYTYRVINLDLTNGLTDEHFPIHAESIYYHWGTSTLEVKLNAASNDPIKLRPKNKIEAPVSQIFVSADARNETVQLFIANPKEIVLGGGEVRVLTDQGYFNTIAGKAFNTFLYRTAVIAKYGYIGICNPANSGIDCVVTDVQLMTDDTHLEICSDTTRICAFTIYSRLLCIGPNAVCKGTTFVSAGLIGTHLTSYAFLPNEPFFIPFLDHYIIPEGCNILFRTVNVNKYLFLNFSMREELFAPE